MKERPLYETSLRGLVGYVSKMFPRLSETFILNEILELERQGLSLRVFSMKRPTEPVVHEHTNAVRASISYLPERIYREPFRIVRAHIAARRCYSERYRETLKYALENYRGRSQALSLLRFSQACSLASDLAQVTHLHAHYATDPCDVAFLVHRLTGIDFSVTTHAKDLFQHDRVKSPEIQERLNKARFVVANSDYSASHLRKYLSPQAKIVTVFNGIELGIFQRRQQEPSEPRILSIGRDVEKKGFGILLKACGLLKERKVPFSCKIVGRITGTLRKHRDNAGLRAEVELPGMLPQKELLAEYQQAMIFVLPCIIASDGDRDILPNVLKEAMAVGVPVVTSKLAGIEELIEDGVNGLLVPPNDVSALAKALQRLLSDRELRRHLSAESRRVIDRRFDSRTSFTRLLALHQEVMRERLAGVSGDERLDTADKSYAPG